MTSPTLSAAFRRPFAGLAPAEWACLGILSVVTATLAVRASAGVDLRADLALHLALLLGFLALTRLLVRLEDRPWTATARPLLVLVVMFTLYVTLGHVAFIAIPWTADGALAELDRLLFFGVSPSLWLDARLTPALTEVLSFGYGFFIPYLYLSIVLGVLGRPAGQRDELITGLALLYAMSFLGYLFAPARGPIVELAAAFAAPISGGFFHQLVVDGVDSAGGPHGALPSLHVGVSFYACAFDLRANRLRGLIYLPIVLLIVVATVALRYHYVVDLVAGVLLAAIAIRLRAPLLARWRRRLAAARAAAP